MKDYVWCPGRVDRKARVCGSVDPKITRIVEETACKAEEEEEKSGKELTISYMDTLLHPFSCRTKKYDAINPMITTEMRNWELSASGREVLKECSGRR